jgi:hypothetical protein
VGGIQAVMLWRRGPFTGKGLLHERRFVLAAQGHSDSRDIALASIVSPLNCSISSMMGLRTMLLDALYGPKRSLFRSCFHTATRRREDPPDDVIGSALKGLLYRIFWHADGGVVAHGYADRPV